MNWRVMGASVAGSSHRAAGLGCDDAHGYRQMDGLLLLAVADGAGSAKLGGQGARIAVETALDTLQDVLSEPRADWEEVFRQAFRITRQVLRAEAYAQQQPLREFATTLLLAVWTPDHLAAAQLGDGAIVARCGEGWERLTTPHEGQHANETLFLTTRNPENRISIGAKPLGEYPLEAVILLTDGLEALALDLRQSQPHPPFFEALYRFAQREGEIETLNMTLQQELCSQAIETRTDDDKTLLIAVQSPPT